MQYHSSVNEHTTNAISHDHNNNKDNSTSILSKSQHVSPYSKPSTVLLKTGGKRLRTVEALARDRELHGYETIQELQAVLRRACLFPSPCRIPLDGPDALFINRNPAAVEFLKEQGFVLEEPELIREDASSPSPGRRKSAQSNAEDGMGHRPASAVLYLPVVPDEVSLDWQVAREEFRDALTLLQWAQTCNTSLITVKLHRLVMFHAFSGDYRVEVTVLWTDELGQSKAQSVSSDFYSTDGAVVLPPVQGSGASQQATWYQNFMASFPTECDQACTVELRIWRRRGKLLYDKLRAVGSYYYKNDGGLAMEVDLKAPEHKEGLPTGRITIEVDSVRHRCAFMTATSSSNVNKNNNFMNIPSGLSLLPTSVLSYNNNNTAEVNSIDKTVNDSVAAEKRSEPPLEASPDPSHPLPITTSDTTSEQDLSGNTTGNTQENKNTNTNNNNNSNSCNNTVTSNNNTVSEERRGTWVDPEQYRLAVQEARRSAAKTEVEHYDADDYY